MYFETNWVGAADGFASSLSVVAGDYIRLLCAEFCTEGLGILSKFVKLSRRAPSVDVGAGVGFESYSTLEKEGLKVSGGLLAVKAREWVVLGFSLSCLFR